MSNDTEATSVFQPAHGTEEHGWRWWCETCNPFDMDTGQGDDMIEITKDDLDKARADAWDEGARAATADYGIGAAMNPYLNAEAG